LTRPQEETELDRKIQKENEKSVASVEYRKRLIMVFSITLGMIAALSTMFILLRLGSPTSLFIKLFGSVFPMMLISGVVVMCMNIFLMAMKARHKRLRETFWPPISSKKTKSQHSAIEP
jgi:hypothetical protein